MIADLEKFEINEYLQKMRTKPIANNGLGRHFSCESGDKLYYRVWQSSNQKKILVAIHGMGAHSEYYVLVADQLVEQGISVYAIDVKHHGLSTGRKGNIESFSEILNQIHEFINNIIQKNKNVPIYLIGLSMGGMLTADYSVLYPGDLKGIILCAPAVSNNFKIKTADILKIPAILYASIFAHAKPIVNIETREALTTRNPLHLSYHDHDKLRLKKVSVRFLYLMAKWVRDTFNKASNITNPIIIFQGTDDQLVSPGGVKEFFDKIPIQDKTFVCLKGAYHSLYSDIAMEEQEGWIKLKNWLNGH